MPLLVLIRRVIDQRPARRATQRRIAIDTVDMESVERTHERPLLYHPEAMARLTRVASPPATDMSICLVQYVWTYRDANENHSSSR